MIALRSVGALSARALLQVVRRPQFLAPIMVFPLLFLALNTGGAGRAVDLPGFPPVDSFLDFQLGATVLQGTMLAGLNGGIALAIDIEGGFFDRLNAAPVPRLVLVVSRLTGSVLIGMAQAVLFLVVGLVFGASIKSGVAGFAIVVLLAGATAAATGALASAVALRTGSTSTVQGFFPLVFVILFLSSAFFPQELLTGPAKTVALYNPLSYVAEALREPIVSGLDATTELYGLLAIAATLALSLGLAVLALRARLRAG